MNLEHIMSKNIITVDINDDIFKVSKIMMENDIGFVPVFENKKIIGVITDRDIVTKVLSNKDDKISSYITRSLISIDSSKSIDDAINLMKDKKVKRLLVSSNNKLVGIISLSDIINYVDSNTLKESLKTIYQINRNTDKYDVDIDEFEL